LPFRNKSVHHPSHLAALEACHNLSRMNQTDLPAPPTRRNFIKQAWAVLIGAVVSMVPLVSGLIVFFDPLRRKSKAGEFVSVASLNALPEDGSPRKFPVIASRIDAWNKSPRTPIGAVYLRRTGD